MVLGATAWVAAIDEVSDRVDPEYYLPATRDMESTIQRRGGRRLADLVDLHVVVPRLRPDAVIEYADIAAVDRRTGTIHTESLLWSSAPSRARRVAEPGDVLLALVRPVRNVVGVVGTDQGRIVCSNGFAVMRPRSVTTWELFAFLKSEVFIRQAIRRCTASMYPTIAEDDVLTVWVPAVDLKPAADKLLAADEMQRSASARTAEALEQAAVALSRSIEIPDV